MFKALKYVCAAAVLTFELSASAADYVIPSGECVGVKLYTDGLIVVGTASVTDTLGNTVSPAADCGIEKGDIIKAVNGQKATSARSLSDAVSDSDAPVTLTVETDGAERNVTVAPAETESGNKLGLWLRDSTAGLGTVTYTDGRSFAALGHAVCDVDTGTIMPVEHGIMQSCTITAIEKGRSGSPGAITGDISGAKLGTVSANTEHGLFGTLDAEPQGTPVPVASPSEVRTGSAVILADVDGSGIREYSVKIKRVAPPSASGKDLVIEVTDDSLINMTGGIIQGMSGAPILQNGKFVGAVTHVFVNDPLSGYGILADNIIGSSQ